MMEFALCRSDYGSLHYRNGITVMNDAPLQVFVPHNRTAFVTVMTITVMNTNAITPVQCNFHHILKIHSL